MQKVKNLDIQILDYLDDKHLDIFFGVNKSSQSLFKNELFWKHRGTIKYGNEFLHSNVLNLPWKNFYPRYNSMLIIFNFIKKNMDIDLFDRKLGYNSCEILRILEEWEKCNKDKDGHIGLDYDDLSWEDLDRSYQRFLEMQKKYIGNMSDKRINMIMMLVNDIDMKNIKKFMHYDVLGFIMESPDHYFIY